MYSCVHGVYDSYLSMFDPLSTRETKTATFKLFKNKVVYYVLSLPLQ